MALSSGMEWLSSLGAAWLPVLVDAAVKGTVILVVASVVSLFVRRASAATRHLVWFLALVGLLGLPAFSVALPGWQVLPAWLDVGQAAARDAQEAAPPAADEPAVSPATDGPPWVVGRAAGRPEASPSQPRHLEAASGSPPAPAAEVSRSGSSAMDLWIWILPLWAAGAALSLAPVVIGLVSLRQLRRASRRVSDGPWAALLEGLSAELGLKRRVVLLRSARRSMPMAWGLVRPKLLIPEEAEGWSAECLRAVLLHELAHIKRWDCLTQLVARVACSLYWFNPLAWLALHRAVAEHERACDDVVLAAGGRAPEYAEHLLKVASRLPAVRFSLGVGIALARPSKLEGRLLAILDRKRSRRAVTRAAVLGAILALAALLVPLAVMRPMVQAEQAAAATTAVAPASAGEGAGAGARPTLTPEAAGPSPDEVLQQLETMVSLEEKILAGVQRRYQAGLATADEVGRQQVKLTDAKLRLVERKAELIAQGKGPRGAGDDAAGPSTPAALQDQIRKLLEEAVAQEEQLLAQMRQRYDVGRATSEDVERQQVRVTEAKLRLAERMAKLIAQGKEPRGAGDEAAGPSTQAALQDQVRKLLEEAVALEERLLAQIRQRYDVGITTSEEVDRQQLRVVEAKVRLAERVKAAAAQAEKSAGAKPGPAPSEKATPAPAAPAPSAATPILKIRSTDGPAVADVHNGAVRVRLGDKTLEAATIIISLDPVAAGTPRKGIALTVRDGAVRISADGKEMIGAQIILHPGGRTEVRSREATADPVKGPAPNDSAITPAKAEPAFGTLDTGCADLGLTLVGEYGSRELSGAGGKWQIPAGWHAATGATLTRSDGAGDLWSLHGVSSWGRLARFDVRAGQMLSLRAGPPLTVKVHASSLQPNGMIHLALALVGQAGEDYNAAPKKSGVSQPPKFRILDEAGKALGSGVFNPGAERTYSWCWWRVPEGFKGKYRVEVEGDFGPFEIVRSEPEWFSVR